MEGTKKSIYGNNKVEVVSLMISHLKGELSPQSEIKMDHLIENCKECKKLYSEVNEFFDPSSALLYEIQNQEKVSRIRSLVFELGSLYDDKIEERDNDLDCENEYKQVFNLIEDTHCDCCGS